MVRKFELAIWSPSYRDADMAFKEPAGLAPLRGRIECANTAHPIKNKKHPTRIYVFVYCDPLGSRAAACVQRGLIIVLAGQDQPLVRAR